MVVRDHHDEWKLVHGGGIESLVESAGGCPSVADAGRAHDALLAFEAACEKRSGHAGDHGPKVADHGIVAVAGTATVDVSVAAAHGAELRAEICAEGVENRVAKSQAPALITDEWSEDVAAAQLDADGDAEGLLATAEEHAALDHASAVKAGEFLLQHTRGEHDAVGFDEIGLGNRRDLFGHWQDFIRPSIHLLQSIPSCWKKVSSLGGGHELNGEGC